MNATQSAVNTSPKAYYLLSTTASLDTAFQQNCTQAEPLDSFNTLCTDTPVLASELTLNLGVESSRSLSNHSSSGFTASGQVYTQARTLYAYNQSAPYNERSQFTTNSSDLFMADSVSVDTWIPGSEAMFGTLAFGYDN